MILALCMSLLSGRVGKGVAPEKVEAADELGAFGPVAYEDLLEDLGRALEDETPGPSEGAAPAETGSDETSDSPGAADAPGDISVTVMPPAETAEAPEETVESAAPPDAVDTGEPAAEPPAPIADES